MLLVIVIVVVVHLNHQTTEVCPTDVPRPVSKPALSPASARHTARQQRAADGWHPAVDKNQKRQLPSPSSALWLQVFTTVYGMIIGSGEEAPIMIYRGRSLRLLCGQVTKRDKWPGICAKCLIYYRYFCLLLLSFCSTNHSQHRRRAEIIATVY